ncbi:hypothetical protein Pint_21618 [Pistacia integerrima]|uniref:Uncharacterized protein n=1 Tax=Pistacia integerrima TaxID=434235 RepID=A0ACC0XEY9_9ROSI|nr:hypothetical protein Pint_21618 [Pistacia integerrima]
MVEIASFVLDVVKCLAAPIGRPFMYLYKYNTNFNNLQKDVEKMKLAKDKVQRKVDDAERNVEKIEETVEKWQKDVDSIIDEAEKLIEEKENHPRCLKGLCPNWITRYKHSKKAFKLKENDIVPLLQQEERFDQVTKTLDVKKVQTEIADKLGVKFDNESERASRLCGRLKSGKKIVLILDNIWEDLDLKTIGIPSKMDCGVCKLLLTTRKVDVLEKMGSTNNFMMGVLSEEEAWTLFKKMGGNCYNSF